MKETKLSKGVFLTRPHPNLFTFTPPPASEPPKPPPPPALGHLSETLPPHSGTPTPPPPPDSFPSCGVGLLSVRSGGG